MKSEQIADKRRIFELFTRILDIVAGFDERQVSHPKSISVPHICSSGVCACEAECAPIPMQAAVVEECINLWTRMMLADSEHDKKVEDNVKASLGRAQDVCTKLKHDLVRECQRLDNISDEHGDAVERLQEALNNAETKLRSKDAEIENLKMQRDEMPAHNPDATRITPRGKAQAVRDIANLLQDPSRRGTEDFERSLDEQMSATMQLPDELHHIHRGKQC